MASPIPYYGGKSRLAPLIIREFPEHHCFVEAFAGSGAVLFRKSPSTVEVLNDVDGDVVNFFRVLRESPKELARVLSQTPYARAEHAQCSSTFHDKKVGAVEHARRFFVAVCQSYSGIVADAFSRSSKKRLAHTFANRVDELHKFAERLRRVQVENLPALKLIAKNDSKETLFYCDPPYLPETRTSFRQGVSRKYRHEMTKTGHVLLLTALNEAKGKVLLSGYDSPLYERMLQGWRVCWRKAAQQVSATGLKDTAAQTRIEVLWANF